MKTYNCLTYVCGPISAPTQSEKKQNMENGIRLARELQAIGVPVFSPHAHSTGLRDDNVDWEDILAYDLEHLNGCSALLTMPGWEKSRGCRLEVAYRYDHHIPVFHDFQQLLVFLKLIYHTETLKEKSLGIYQGEQS